MSSRLSRISTIWTLVAQARARPENQSGKALVALLERYRGAAYRYLLGAVGSPDLADELFQEFALRLARGAFRFVDPKRGRFRDYLKSTLYHLVVDCQKQRHKAHRSLDTGVPEPAAWDGDPDRSHEQFVQNWRGEMLARAWTLLRQQERSGGQPFFSVLKYRAEHPRVSSAEMAARLTERLQPDRPFTSTGIRKTLERARCRFAQALIDEVAHSLDNPTDDELEQELIDLGLLAYCRSALQRLRTPHNAGNVR
jgi:RNA polymerase sigma-70 factor (ECF subfamily)